MDDYVLYDDSDVKYRDTPLVSTVPKPYHPELVKQKHAHPYARPPFQPPQQHAPPAGPHSNAPPVWRAVHQVPNGASAPPPAPRPRRLPNVKWTPDWFDTPRLSINDLLPHLGTASQTSTEDTNCFCDPALLAQLKTLRASLGPEEVYLIARANCDPVEQVRHPWTHRAAMVLADLNANLGWTKREKLQCVDLCGGGATSCLKERAQVLHVSDELQKQMIAHERDIISDILGRHDGTPSADLVFAGGYGDFIREEEEEYVKYFVSQVIVALGVIQQHGDVVLRLFDVTTWATLSVLYLLSTLFKQICIAKPVTSRPSESERFVVCQDFTSSNSDRPKLIDKLLHWRGDAPLLTPSIVKQDALFLEYIHQNNTTRLLKQIKACNEIKACIEKGNKETKTPEMRQDMQTALHTYWGMASTNIV